MATEAQMVAALQAVQTQLTTLLTDDQKLLTDLAALIASLNGGVVVPQADVDAITAAAQDQATRIAAAITAVTAADAAIPAPSAGMTGPMGP